MQTTVQILRCLTLGQYTALVVDGELEIGGPQPLADPLPASIRARRDELIDFLVDYCAGTWPPPAGSRFFFDEGDLGYFGREEDAA